MEEIPGGAGQGCHDRPLGHHKGVEQARFADVCPPDDQHVEAATYCPSLFVREGELTQTGTGRPEGGTPFSFRPLDLLFGEIDERLDLSKGVSEVPPDLFDRLREEALELIEGKTKLRF